MSAAAGAAGPPTGSSEPGSLGRAVPRTPGPEAAGAASQGSDRYLSVVVPAPWGDEVGAILMDALGPYEEVSENAAGGDALTGGPWPLGPSGAAGAASKVRLVFYPDDAAAGMAGATAAPQALAPPGAPDTTPPVTPLAPPPLSADYIVSLLPPELQAPGAVRVEYGEVSRDWVEGWRDHFQPIHIGRVRIRPPWEPPLDDAETIDVVINPGMGFGTGLHPTTRGTLQLLQAVDAPVGTAGGEGPDGTGSADAEDRASAPAARLLDAGTGSGVLAIAAAKLGWGPVVAFDNDPVALVSARDNVDANGVTEVVELLEAGVDDIRPEWSGGATVLANMTLEPVLLLLDRLVAAGPQGRPRRLVVSGILAGAQEQQLLRAALSAGFTPRQKVYETEWVSLELLPASSHEPVAQTPDAGGPVGPPAAE